MTASRNTDSLRHCLTILLAIALNCGAPQRATGDAGFKPDDSQLFTVTLAGGPLPDPEFVAAMVCQNSNPNWDLDSPFVNTEVPGLKLVLPPGDSGGDWTYATYRAGGKGKDGNVHFSAFMRGTPQRFRIAVYLPSQDKIYLTNDMRPHILLRQYRIDLQRDGTATLARDNSDSWLADAILKFLRRGILQAIAITLVCELLVVVLLVRILGKREWLSRMTIICICVNLLTLIPLWIASELGVMMLGLWSGAKAMVVFELFVVVVEGSIYATLGRIGWSRGLAIAFFANATSFLLGLAIG